MKNTPLRFGNSEESPTALRSTSSGPTLAEIELFGRDWLCDGEYRQHSPQTIAFRKLILAKLVWFLKRRSFEQCGTIELRQFFAYLSNGHKEAGGRWGNPQNTKPVSARTVKDYHGALRTFFEWLKAQELLAVSPIARIAQPIHRADQI